jgi:hypothetical protein
MTNSSTTQQGVDPRGLRFVAGVTGVLLLVVIGLWLSGLTVAAFIVLAWITLVFAWGVFVGIRRNPYSVFFRLVIRPRIGAPKELEDSTPPTFAQGMGGVITFIGLALSLIPGVGLALPIARSPRRSRQARHSRRCIARRNR